MNTIPTKPLSARERAILVFIRTHWNEKNYAPSLRDIADHLHTSTSVASYHVIRLERKHWLLVPRMDTGEIVAHTMRLTATAESLLRATPAHVEVE